MSNTAEVQFLYPDSWAGGQAGCFSHGKSPYLALRYYLPAKWHTPTLTERGYAHPKRGKMRKFAILLLIVVSPGLAKAQTATTHCDTYGNQTDCTTTTNTPPPDPWAKMLKEQSDRQSAERIAREQAQVACANAGNVWAGGLHGCLTPQQVADLRAERQAAEAQKLAAKQAKDEQKRAEKNYKECIGVNKHDAALQQTCADRYPH